MGKRRPRTIALDFDGVLHRYNGWQGGKIDGPIDGALDAVNRLVELGHTVVVFSTRDPVIIAAWLAAHAFPPLQVTNVKNPFYVIVDDRAVRFDGTWGDDMVQQIHAFEPYWIKARRDPSR